MGEGLFREEGMAEKYQVMPPLSQEEYTALKEDIRENGVRVPVVKDVEGVTIDGHHRERAVAELRAEGYDVPDCPQEVRPDLTTDAEKRSLAWRLNMQRRHLSTEDKRKIIKAKLKETPQWSNNRIARFLGVSDHTVLAARLHLERTSQITKFDFLEGEDGKTRPRNKKRELEKEFKQTQEVSIRRSLLGNPEWDDARLAKKYGVTVKDVADQRLDLAVNGIKETDRADPNDLVYGRVAHDDLRRMAMRTIPRGRSWAAKEVSEALRGEAVRRLLRAIDGRKIDAPVSPQEIIEEMSGNQRGACDISLLKGRLEDLERLGEWLTEFARLLDLEPGQGA